MAHKFSEGSNYSGQAPGQQAGISRKIAALPGSNGEDFQPISKIHGLLCGQEKKQEYMLMKYCLVPALEKPRVSLVTGILNRRGLSNLTQKSITHLKVPEISKRSQHCKYCDDSQNAVSLCKDRVSVCFG